MITIVIEDGAITADLDGESFCLNDQELADALAAAVKGTGEARVVSDFSAATLASMEEMNHRGPVPLSDSSRPNDFDASEQPGEQPSRRQPALEMPFLEVLRRRASARSFELIHRDELRALLYNSCRVADSWVSEDGFILSHRPSPSAGARHPIHVKPLVNQASGLDSGLYAYDADANDLVRHPSGPAELADLNREVDDVSSPYAAPAPVLLFLLAESRRTLSRYPRGFGHLLLDAGALAATIQLTATALGLRTRFLSVGSDSALLGVLGVSRPEFFVPGVIMLGGASD